MTAGDVAINALGGSVVAFSLTWIISLVRSIKLLDDDRSADIAKEQNTNAAALPATDVIYDGIQKISDLQSALSLRHPHDEHKERIVSAALADLTELERTLIIWLLDAGKVSRGIIQSRGLNADALFNKHNGPLLLSFESHRPGNGTVELDRFYYINQNTVDAIRNVLHPPSRIE